MTKIQSKPHNYGNENESSWPSINGTGEKGVFYFDRETQQFLPGLPPPSVVVYGEAPYVISDTINPYYHPKAERWIDSRSDLNATDKALGTITTDKKLAPDSYQQRQAKKARDLDVHVATRKAIAAIDSGNAPISEKTRELCKEVNEQVSKRLNFDAFNVAGRKNDKRGRKYRRK